MRKSQLHQIEDYLNGYLESETVQSYLFSIEKFLCHYPHAQRFELHEIEKYMLALKTKRQSVGYRSVTLAAIKNYYNFLLDQGTIKYHPCRTLFISEKRTTGRDFNDLLTMEEMQSLLVTKAEQNRYPRILNRDLAIIGMMIYQGMTSREIIKLRLEDCDEFAKLIRIPGSKKRKARTIKLDSVQVDALRDYIHLDRPALLKGKTDKVFISMRGMPLTEDQLHHLVSSMQLGYDRNLNPENIRNSVISHWLNVKRMPLEDVQIMAGHFYPSTTEAYLKNDTDGQRKAVTELHQMIFG